MANGGLPNAKAVSGSSAGKDTDVKEDAATRHTIPLFNSAGCKEAQKWVQCGSKQGRSRDCRAASEARKLETVETEEELKGAARNQHGRIRQRRSARKGKNLDCRTRQSLAAPASSPSAKSRAICAVPRVCKRGRDGRMSVRKSTQRREGARYHTTMRTPAIVATVTVDARVQANSAIPPSSSPVGSSSLAFGLRCVLYLCEEGSRARARVL